MKELFASIWKGLQVIGVFVTCGAIYLWYTGGTKVYIGDVHRSGDVLTFNIGNPSKSKQETVFWVTPTDKDKGNEDAFAVCNSIATIPEDAQQTVTMPCDKIPDGEYFVHSGPAKRNEQIAATAKRIFIPSNDPKNAASQCDEVAASDYDNDRPTGVSGVNFAKMDASLAEAACSNALRLDNQNLRLAFETARAAQKAGEHKDDMVALYKHAAESGYVAAMANYSVVLAKKEFVDSPNEEESASWARKAAVGGNVAGMFNFGMSLLTGNGVSEDDAQALTWMRKSAEGGFPAAMSQLAAMYVAGKGAPADKAQAQTWAKRAMEKGDPNAQQVLNAANQASTP